MSQYLYMVIFFNKIIDTNNWLDDLFKYSIYVNIPYMYLSHFVLLNVVIPEIQLNLVILCDDGKTVDSGELEDSCEYGDSSKFGNSGESGDCG